jgi:hypothetical protein
MGIAALHRPVGKLLDHTLRRSRVRVEMKQMESLKQKPGPPALFVTQLLAGTALGHRLECRVEQIGRRPLVRQHSGLDGHDDLGAGKKREGLEISENRPETRRSAMGLDLAIDEAGELFTDPTGRRFGEDAISRDKIDGFALTLVDRLQKPIHRGTHDSFSS